MLIRSVPDEAKTTIPRLPETLLHLRMHHWDYVPLAVLPSNIETLDTGEADRTERRNGFHIGRTWHSLQFSENPSARNPQLFILPQLSMLSHLNLSVEGDGFCIVPGPSPSSMWPATLTSLVISLASSALLPFATSISHLPLRNLSLICNITTAPSAAELLTDRVVQLFPKTLTSLSLTNFGLQTCAWALLPPSITKLLTLMHSNHAHNGSWRQPLPPDLPPRLSDLCIVVNSRKNAISDFFRPHLKRLTIKDLATRGELRFNVPSTQCLVELHINTSAGLPKSFCSSLPRTLLRLCVEHGKLKLSGVQHLPENLELLSTNGALHPVNLLPRKLTHLQFTHLTASTAAKGPALSPAEIAENLPRSLTFLFIKRAYAWDENCIPHLPDKLTYCRIDRSEDFLRYFDPRDANFTIQNPDAVVPDLSKSGRKRSAVDANTNWWHFYGVWIWLFNVLAAFGLFSKATPTSNVTDSKPDDDDVYDMFPNVQY